MSKGINPRLLVVGATPAVVEALAAYCPRANMAVLPDSAAALDYLRKNVPQLVVIDAAGIDAVSLVSAIKSDARARAAPLLILCKSGAAALLDACYRAGANACVVKPADEAALREAAGALVAFWLGANETPPADA